LSFFVVVTSSIHCQIFVSPSLFSMNIPSQSCITLVRVRVTSRLAVYLQSVRLGDNPLRLTTSNLFSNWTLAVYSLYVTSSLTRRWVYRLQLLLGFVSAVILKSESCGTHYHILLAQIRESPYLEAHVPVFISPGTWFLFVASYDSQGYGGGIRSRLHTDRRFLINDEVACMYRMSQEERSVFWEIIVPVIRNRNVKSTVSYCGQLEVNGHPLTWRWKQIHFPKCCVL
jgi:hypothetical protein